MAIELLNLSSPNDGLGDTLRDGGVKINNNFTFLDTTKQNADADLTAIAGLAGTSGLLRKTAANTWTLDTASYLTTTGNGSGLTNVNAATLDGIDSSQFLRKDSFNGGSTGTIQLNDGFGFIIGTDSDAILRHSGGNNLLDLNSGNFVIRDNITNRFTFERTTGLFTCSQINTGQGATEVYLMNQNVRTTDAVTFATVNTGFGNNELYPMNQAVRTTDNVSFATVNTGQGNNLLYAMNQNVRTTDTVNFLRVQLDNAAVDNWAFRADTNNVNFSGIYFSSAEDGQLYLRSAAGTASILSPDGAGGFSTGGNIVCGQINTGQGATEVYAMNQNVRNTDSPIFSGLTVTNAITVGSIITSNWTIDQVGTDLVFSYNGAEKLRILSTGGATETV